MKKSTKILLVVVICLAFVSGIAFAGVMTALDWDFSKLSTAKLETNEYEISEAFENISVKTHTAELVFTFSDDGICRVECEEEQKAKHSVAVKDGTLVIKTVNEKAWYDYIGISFTSPKITVYLPKVEYGTLKIKENTGDIDIPGEFKFKDVDVSLSTGDISFSASTSNLLKVKTTTGNIHVENATVGSFDFSASTGGVTVSDIICHGNAHAGVSTGKTKFKNIVCKNLDSSADTGDISLDNVIITENVSIKTSTGDIKLKNSDAAELLIETNTGDVKGNLLTDKIYLTSTDTGKVSVPKTMTGGKCEITTDTGNISMKGPSEE